MKAAKFLHADNEDSDQNARVRALTSRLIYITKTCLYNFDPLKPHFYTVKLGFTGVYISFYISAQNIDFGYSLERLAEAVLTSTHNLCFEQKYKKYQNFYLKILKHFGGKIFNIFE